MKMAYRGFDDAKTAQPELVIGVDFGMSQTGVAYCTSPWTNPRTFQNWSNVTFEVYNKTPSRLAYDKDGLVQSWGYFVNIDETLLDIKEYFKLYLDPEYNDGYQDMSHQVATHLYLDYLICIHDHIARFFRPRYPQWATMHVEWNFSVPTTWKSAALVNHLLGIIRQAGFGQDGPNHVCEVTLTEAEAAAVYVAGSTLQRDDVILVCDAGGGTTDVNAMKVKSSPNEPLCLEQMIQVEGREIGSALIDIRMQQLLTERLIIAQQYLQAPAQEIAEKMMLGKFERFKCAFGSPGVSVPRIFLPVPGLGPGFDLPLAGIHNSQMELSQDLIKPLFDEQADGLIDLIQEQLVALRRTRPGEEVSYLVLSGGLASSEYIQSRLKSYFTGREGSINPNARRMQPVLAESMQLAVVQGLVKHRVQQLSTMTTPIVRRCAPVSYGVVVSQRYNESKHLGQRTIRDPRDKKRWAVDQIEWLIRKGDPINNEGVSKVFHAKLGPAQLRKPWRAHFVYSTEAAENLPQSMAERSHVRTLCVVTANIERVQRVVRNRHWWNFGERHELAKLETRLCPGYADLKIKLLSNGKQLNRDDDMVDVRWITAKTSPSLHGDNDLDQPFAYTP